MAKIKLVDVRKENRSKSVCIDLIMKKGKINTYIVDGYKAYDEEELERYYATVKKGRPLGSTKEQIKGE